MKRGLKWFYVGLAASPLVAGALCIFPTWTRTTVIHGPEERCRYLMADFVAGLKTYQVEYNRFPDEAFTSPHGQMPQRTRSTILNVLMGKEDKCNPRKIDLYDPPPAKANKRGLYYDPQNRPVLADPWGEPFYFIVDLKDELKIPNPDPRDNKEPPSSMRRSSCSPPDRIAIRTLGKTTS